MIETEQHHCEGCGVRIQTEDESRPGYAPSSALKREHIVCKRCYRIRHYNDIAPVDQDPDVYLQKLQEIAHTDSLVVLVVDIFDLAGSWIQGIHRHIGNNPLLLLANKIDLFPKSVKWGRLKDWVRATAKELGVDPIEIALTSAAKGEYFRQTVEAIEHHRKGRDVYIIGVTNVGKSTFVNRLLKEFGEEEEYITTSPYPGTTLDSIYIPLEDGKAIIDTPGIVRKDRMSEWVTPKELQIVMPQSGIKPKVFQLNEQQTLFFGGLVRFDFLEGEKQSFVTYLSNRLYIHRTKLEKADEIQTKHRGSILTPPEDPAQLPKWRKHRIQLNGKEKQDIVIAGLGWIACGQDRAVIDVWAPEGVQVGIRPAII
ncbi:ribosome biogenesis GTPase YqeH [Croceifilum oryzae]|uniref:Ribosome biogenesis GTPase YqeH n=1 Tax=Croceifilum oryzae TaxID=1553429 RepID=A0AAJ1TK60_9BACL|nr:ribosome biogenesis GTPase YqeH [Croceifilum oryzae]